MIIIKDEKLLILKVILKVLEYLLQSVYFPQHFETPGLLVQRPLLFCNITLISSSLELKS